MMKEGILPQIIEIVGDYLRAWNDKTMVKLYTGTPTHDRRGIEWKLAKEHDLLGWQTLLKGEYRNSTSKSSTVGTRQRRVKRQPISGRQVSLRIWSKSHTINGRGEMRGYTSDGIQELKMYLNVNTP